jgi:hypothetical protein
MEFSPNHSNSLQGAQFLPFISPSEPYPSCFSKNLPQEFEDYLLTIEGRSKKILTHSRQANYRYWLQNPEAKSVAATPEDRQREANDKHHCLKHFVLDKGQVYRMAGVEKGREYSYRYCVCTWDAAKIMIVDHGG